MAEWVWIWWYPAAEDHPKVRVEPSFGELALRIVAPIVA